MKSESPPREWHPGHTKRRIYDQGSTRRVATPYPAQIRQALINTDECSDGMVHNGVGCIKEWKDDPDDDTLAFNEPLVNAQRASSVVIRTDRTPPRSSDRLNGHRRRRLRQPKLG